MPILGLVRKVINIIDYWISIRDRVVNYIIEQRRKMNEKKIDRYIKSDNVSGVKRIMHDIKRKREDRRNKS